MGVVEESNYEFLKGLNAFYYSCFPEDDGICILKMKDGFGYQMFTRMPVEDKPEEVQATAITEEQALEAIKNYCILQNPQLKEMMESGDQSFYWASTMNEKGEIVILYRSYTAAQIRYYIDPNTGDTYVTEFVPGITDEEERTEETFNIKDYM